jgi:hypothetical protein
VPLLTPKPLTSYKFGGWEFTQLPEVDDWAGDKTEIPTNEVGPTREIEGTAQRARRRLGHRPQVPGLRGHRVLVGVLRRADRVLRAQDRREGAAAIVAAAQDVTGTAPVTGYTRPTGYGTPVEQADVLRAVAFGTAYLEDTPLIEQGPDYVLMNTQDWLSLLDLTNLDLPAFLSLMGVQPGSVPAVQLGCPPGRS